MADADVIPLGKPDPGRRPQQQSEPEVEPLLRDVVGDVLRRTRREQRRTLADVADEAQVSTPYLSEIERGRKEASSEVLSAVCRALGIGVVDLVSRAHIDLTERAAQRREAMQARTLRIRPTRFDPRNSPVALAA